MALRSKHISIATRLIILLVLSAAVDAAYWFGPMQLFLHPFNLSTFVRVGPPILLNALIAAMLGLWWKGGRASNPLWVAKTLLVALFCVVTPFVVAFALLYVGCFCFDDCP